MERKILFKAKKLSDGKWVKGDLLHKGEEVLIRHTTTIGGEEHIKSVLVDPSTVCQFTGLKDKEGKDVYEHDLLKHGTSIYEVEYENGSFAIVHWLGKDPLSSLLIKDSMICTFINIGSKFDRKEV